MDEVSSLDSRFASLERSNRLLKWSVFCLAAALVGVIGWLVAQRIGVSDLIRTRCLEVLSPNGKVIARLSYAPALPGGSLTMYDKEGERRGWFNSGTHGGSVGLLGSGEKSKAYVAAMSVWRDRADLTFMDGETEHLTSYSLEGSTTRLTSFDSKGFREMATTQLK